MEEFPLFLKMILTVGVKTIRNTRIDKLQKLTSHVQKAQPVETQIKMVDNHLNTFLNARKKRDAKKSYTAASACKTPLKAKKH